MEEKKGLHSFFLASYGLFTSKRNRMGLACISLEVTTLFYQIKAVQTKKANCCSKNLERQTGKCQESQFCGEETHGLKSLWEPVVG